MSFFEDASLVMIPSGIKDQKVYSVKPTDGSGDLTFSRGSDIEATRVNANGYIEKAKVNLLLQSNTFDTTWTIARTTILGGQSGYDGTNNAWKVTPNTDNNTHAVLQAGAVAANGVYTFSVYAKANGYNYIALRDSASVDGYARFDLQNGLTSTSGTSAISSKITSVGGDWYRCELSVNKTSGAGDNFVIYVNETYLFNEVYVGDGTSSVLIQSAQANYGLVAQEYQETTTTSVVAGITNDLPRLDYSGGASCPSLKLEPSRRNYFAFSEYFGAADWLKTNAGSAAAPVVTDNYAVSPEGVQNAARVQFDAVGTSSADRSGLVRQFSFITGETYSISCWAKATSGSGEIVQFRIAGAQVGGELTATSEWQRFSVTHTATTTTTDDFGIQVRGNNTTNESDILIYGMQLEKANFSTSYIPCYGTSATRTADDASKTGISSLIGQTEGTLFFEFKKEHDGTETISINDGSSSNRVYLGFNGSNFISQVRSGGGAAQASFTTALTNNQTYKCALAYKLNDFVLYINGVQIGTDNSGIVPVGMSKFSFNASTNVDAPFFSPVNQAILFKTRLSNSDLAALTSL